jgi:hypothetical protein
MMSQVHIKMVGALLNQEVAAAEHPRVYALVSSKCGTICPEKPP